MTDRLRGNRAAAVVVATLFVVAAAVVFAPIAIPHKIALPVGVLALAALWLCPREVALALLFSAGGDFAGTCGNFLAQMGLFAIGHIFYIAHFVGRYRACGISVGKMSSGHRAYLVVAALCTVALVVFALCRIAPEAPAGAIRIGVGIYAVIIGAMMLLAQLQRSAPYGCGAALFVLSDFILAWNMFVTPIPHSTILILVPYFAAQVLIFLKATK